MKSSFTAFTLALTLLLGSLVSPTAAIGLRLRFPGLHIGDNAPHSTEDGEATAAPSRFNLRRRTPGLFDSNGSSGNGNGGKLDLIVVLNEEGTNARVRKLSQGKGQAIAAANRAKAKAVAKGLGVIPEHAYGAALYGFSVRGATQAQKDAIEASDDVDYVEIDQIVQLDPMEMEDEGSGRRLRPADKKHRQLKKPPWAGGGGDEETSSQTIPWGITSVLGGKDGTGKIAYILDTGIDLNHPDLIVDASKGFNVFTTGKDGKSLDDGNGHGTHVAGTVAAIDNGFGAVGVAEGATVVPVKVLSSSGSGSYAGVIAGIDWVKVQCEADNAAGTVAAANMSLGGGKSPTVNAAVEAASANCPFALAAGNESTDAGTRSPASANGDNIYTVCSTTSAGSWSSFSNYGDPPVDYCAPGSSVYSTYKNGGYATLSGTSMAAPHVCGILLVGTHSGGTLNSQDTVSGPDGVYAMAST